VTSPLTASAVTKCPAPVSYTGVQSQASDEHDVSQPAPPLSQTNSPPATQWSMSLMSSSNGAMNCGPGSHGDGVYVNAPHDGVISAHAFVS
jgi:hypothetical protein